MHYKIINATVAGIVTRKGDPSVICLTRRGIEPYKGYWCLPGGHIEAWEPAIKGAVREVEEETGMSFKAGFFNYFDEIIPEKDIHNEVLVFTGEETEITEHQVLSEEHQKELAQEVTEMQWIQVGDALKLPLAFRHKIIIEAYLKSL
jgi:8-oxo-dGTP diphosphatase